MFVVSRIRVEPNKKNRSERPCNAPHLLGGYVFDPAINTPLQGCFAFMEYNND
jgi:hypothetical protein